MSAPDAIFDIALARRRLARAFAQGPADFLLARAAADIAERLEVVQRRFTRIGDIGTPGPSLAEALATRWPEARVVRVGPSPSPLWGGVRGGGSRRASRSGPEASAPRGVGEAHRPPPLTPPHKGGGGRPRGALG